MALYGLLVRFEDVFFVPMNPTEIIITFSVFRTSWVPDYSLRYVRSRFSAKWKPLWWSNFRRSFKFCCYQFIEYFEFKLRKRPDRRIDFQQHGNISHILSDSRNERWVLFITHFKKNRPRLIFKHLYGLFTWAGEYNVELQLLAAGFNYFTSHFIGLWWQYGRSTVQHEIRKR